MSNTDAFLEMFDIKWYENGGQLQTWQSLNLTKYGDDSKTIFFTVHMKREETVNGTLVATVRPSYDNTKIYVTNVKTT